MNNRTVLLSTAYFPPVEFFVALANARTFFIEQCEIFQKQSYRTRCHIYSATGLFALTLPVKRGDAAAEAPEEVSGKHTHKMMIRDVLIDYSKPWVLRHKRAIEAAYMTSPFFEYYKDDLFGVLDSREPSLFMLNLRIIELLCDLIGISPAIQFTNDYYHNETAVLDLREKIHPKSKTHTLLQELKMEKPYYQVFSDKQGFIPNLSILDLLCNEGPNSISFLKTESD